MRIRVLSALIAVGIAGSAIAQAPATSTKGRTPTRVPTPTTGIAPPAPPLQGPRISHLPPLPPGCGGDAAPRPPTPPAPPALDDAAFRSELGLSADKASQARQAFARQRQERDRFEQQRREANAGFCRDLRGIVGEQGIAKWHAAMPAPPTPPAPPAPPREGGIAPPPPAAPAAPAAPQAARDR